MIQKVCNTTCSVDKSFPPTLESQAMSVSQQVSEFFNFSVDKFPLSFPDNQRTSWYGLQRSDTSEQVGSPVSSRYLPHTTDDVVAMVEAAETAFDGQAAVKCCWNEGHYVIVQPSIDQRLAVYGTKDNVFPRLVIRAGYDGKAYSGSLCLYRDACKNLAMMRKVSGVNVSIRHTGNLRCKMDSLISTMSKLKDSWSNLTAVVQHMESKPVVLADFLNEMYPVPTDSGRSQTEHKNRTEAIVNRLINERYKTGRPALEKTVSSWEMYNAIQGYSQWDRRRNGTKDVLKRAIMSWSDPSVIKAESLLVG